MKIAIGCDHGGFELKEAVREYLEQEGIGYKDHGAFSTDSVDYVPIAAKAARQVAAGEADYGILICSTGIGISIAANKVKGIRAALCTNEFCAEMTRRHNNANILCMGGKVVDRETAVKLVKIFLHTEFEGGRHQRRISQIAQIEEESLAQAFHGKFAAEEKKNVFVLDHPLIQHKLTFLRDMSTGTKNFRELVSEIATLMCYEATRDLPLMDVETVTPMQKTVTKMIAGRKLAFVPILRAGLGMVDGMLNLVPSAKVGHIGLYRDHETLKPVEYYNKLPEDMAERDVIVLDPMLATGGSAVDAITIVKRSHPKSVKFLCIIAAPEGIEVLTKEHPDVQVYCAAVDEKLNDNGYILPGLGDAGDRIFGTI